MPIIKEEKPTQKITLNLSEEVFSLYDENKKTAKALGLKLDFDEEFERWFKKQNEKVKAELAERQPTTPKEPTPKKSKEKPPTT